MADIPFVYVTVPNEDSIFDRPRKKVTLGYIHKPFDNSQLSVIFAMAMRE